MNPLVVHVVRPYSSEDEYLATEAWSIEPRGMLLIDAEALPADTPLLFDVALADGHKPIRAEGRVVGSVPAHGARPGGLRVRFKRFGAATKAFIERAVQAKSSPTAAAPSSPAAAPRSSNTFTWRRSSRGWAIPTLLKARPTSCRSPRRGCCARSIAC